ncbi:MAG TPA: hypothetical protein VNS63_15165 [Blastocatellia bacterium]|nr:hypothetical protein [Blastocatellia bacterium]
MKRVAFVLMVAIALMAWGSRVTSAHSNAQRGSELLQLLPDGNILAVIDVQRMTGSSLWATLSAQPKVKSTLDKMQSDISEIGVRLSDIQTVALVFSGKDFDNPTVAVVGSFDQDGVLSHLRANPKIKLTSEKYKNYDVYKSVTVPASTPGDAQKPGAVPAPVKPNETAFYFIDSKTAVVGSTAGVRASIDVKSGSRASVAQNSKLTEAIAQNASAAIRFAITMTPSMAGGLSSSLPIPDFSSVNLIFGALNMASGVDLNATLRSDTADHAKVVAERLNGLVMMFKGFLTSVGDPKMSAVNDALKSVSIVGNDIDVTITASLPQEFFTQIFK